MFILYCRRAIVEDLRFVPEKMGEFMKETQGKDTDKLMKLQILGREFELRTQQETTQSMASLPRCDELRESVKSSKWEDMFILYYRRAVVEDLRLARIVNSMFVLRKTAEFIRETSGKDSENMHTKLSSDIKLLSSTAENNANQNSSKGTLLLEHGITFMMADLVMELLVSFEFLGVGCAVVAGLDGGVPGFQAEEGAVFAAGFGDDVPVFQEDEPAVW
ncbi:hypothetical protein Tco_0523741 [Tanacetum coccineum]